MLWAGNYYIDYYDKGQISRRLLVANFEKQIRNPNSNLKQNIIASELPALINKCIAYYNKALQEHRSKSIWDFCPEYFKTQQLELRCDRNPLFRYLTEYATFKEGASTPLSTIRDRFSTWIGKDVKKLENGTFFQVNKEFSVEVRMICKTCLKDHKVGCCEDYDRLGRTSKQVVRNLELVG
jgi:hypothetical protein